MIIGAFHYLCIITSTNTNLHTSCNIDPLIWNGKQDGGKYLLNITNENEHFWHWWKKRQFLSTIIKNAFLYIILFVFSASLSSIYALCVTSIKPQRCDVWCQHPIKILFQTRIWRENFSATFCDFELKYTLSFSFPSHPLLTAPWYALLCLICCCFAGWGCFLSPNLQCTCVFLFNLSALESCT